MTVNANLIVKHVIQIKYEIMIHVNVSVKIIIKCNKDYSWNPSKCICVNGKYLKSIIDESVIKCNGIIKITSNIPTNVTSTVSINSDDKKARCKMNYYVLHTVLLVIVLLFVINFIYCHYVNRSKQKHFEVLSI